MAAEKLRVSVDSDLEDLVPGFLDNRVKDMAAIHEALASGEMGQAGRIGHKMKGSGGAYGFDEITAIGARIEELARDSNADGIAQQVQRLSDYLAALEIEYV